MPPFSPHRSTKRRRGLFPQFIKRHRARILLILVNGRAAVRLQTLRLLSTDARPFTNGRLKTRAVEDAPPCFPLP